MATTRWSDVRNERDHEPGFAEAYARADLLIQFGASLSEARTRAGLSQSQLARRVGSTQPYIARLEAGGADVKLSTLVRLAEVFGQPFQVSAAGVNAA